MGFNCYIDESGDEGINPGGSRWFVLGALIVRSDHDLKISEMIPRIKCMLKKDERSPLHWSHTKRHEHKLLICDEMSKEQWTFSCIIADKKHPSILNAAGLKEKWKLYCYATRLLLERISWFARDNGGTKAHIIFEQRTNINCRS
jgi:hypothetical protein